MQPADTAVIAMKCPLGTQSAALSPKAVAVDATYVSPVAYDAMSFATESRTGSRTVIVADDEALIRMNAALVLSDAGFAVLEAEHAAHVLDVLQDRHAGIHLLFTDIHMPGVMDGLALVHHVRGRWPAIGLLLTSGNARPHASLLPWGCRFLAKPYEAAHLLGHIGELFPCA